MIENDTPQTDSRRSESTRPNKLHRGERQLDELQGQLVLLMNHYTLRADAHIAAAVRDTMLTILRHPLIDLFPDFRGQCARALNSWRARSACTNEPNRLDEALH